MEDARTIILPPGVAVGDDTGLRLILEFFAECTDARWAELEIRSRRLDQVRVIRRYPTGDSVSVEMTIDDDIDVVLTLAEGRPPEQRVLDLLRSQPRSRASAAPAAGRDRAPAVRGQLCRFRDPHLRRLREHPLRQPSRRCADLEADRERLDGRLEDAAPTTSLSPAMHQGRRASRRCRTRTMARLGRGVGRQRADHRTGCALERRRLVRAGRHGDSPRGGRTQDQRVDEFAAQHQLSPREQEVLHLLVQGYDTPGLADRLGISPHTVRDHLKNVFRKTSNRSRSELLSALAGAGNHNR